MGPVDGWKLRASVTRREAAGVQHLDERDKEPRGSFCRNVRPEMCWLHTGSRRPPACHELDRRLQRVSGPLPDVCEPVFIYVRE